MKHISKRFMPPLLLLAVLCTTLQARADDPVPPESKHRLMKECMAKQKASDGGIPKEEMKKNCKDVTGTEADNAKAAKEPAAASDTPHE